MLREKKARLAIEKKAIKAAISKPLKPLGNKKKKSVVVLRPKVTSKSFPKVGLDLKVAPLIEEVKGVKTRTKSGREVRLTNRAKSAQT